MPATEGRRRGRRGAVSPKVEEKHRKAITAANQRKHKAKKDLEDADIDLAKKIDAAISENVETQKIAAWLKVSRQMIPKILSKLTKKAKQSKPSESKKKDNPFMNQKG